MKNSSRKQVPYISFSVQRLPALLKMIKSLEPIEKGVLINEASRRFSKSRKTIQEFIISLKNLMLVEERDGKILLTKSSSSMILNDEKQFWGILRQELLSNATVLNILDAISLMSKEEKRVTSSEEYYQDLSRILQTEFSFTSASPRELDRFITLFRRMKILDYDPYSNGYFLVRKNIVDERCLETILVEKYQEIRNEMTRRTGTSWIPINQLRSKVCISEGIATEAFDRLIKRIWDENGYEFAEASASRKEVRKGGIEKNGKIYFYIKME